MPPSRPYSFAPALSGEGIGGRVSAVVVHYRGADDLAACVAALFEQDWPDLEVVVVDNGSTDGGVAALDRDAVADSPGRRLRRVHMPGNGGFGAGANAGLQAATGDLLFVINPDARPEPGCVTALVAADADVATARVLLLDDPGRLDNAGHSLYPDGLNWCRGRGLPAVGRFVEPDDVLFFSGAAVLFRRSALLRTGLFDPTFFAYGEDADLSLRVAARSLTCRYVPTAIVGHRVGGSFGRLGFRKVFLVERNRARVALTHLPWSWVMASPVWTLIRHAAMAKGAASGEGLAASWSPGRRALLPLAVLAAHAASVFEIPGSLARRRAVGERPARARLDAARVGPAELMARPAGA